MRPVAAWVIDYLVNSIWQIPLIFLAASASVRLVRRMGPQVKHSIWATGLVVAALLPAFHINFNQWTLMLWSSGRGNAVGTTSVTSATAEVARYGLLRLPTGLLAGIDAAYLCSVLYFMLRLGVGLWKTGAMRRNAQSVDLTGELKTCWDRHCRIFQVHRATLAITPSVSGPVVVGLWRSWLLLPPNLLKRISTQDLDAALAHEFAHMRRRDFAKNIVHAALSLPVTYHPVMWLLQSRVAESREMICDGQAAESVEGKENYVRSLLRLASVLSTTPQPAVFHAIGIFDANTLERRIMNLKMKRMEINGAQRFIYAAACILIGVATCTSALALRLDVQDQTSTAITNGKSHGNVTPPKIIYRKAPVYPAKAKADKNWVDGPCVLLVSVNKEGQPTNVRVVKSLRADYDKSAVTAVRDWRFSPALRDGKPVAADTKITIRYEMEK